MAGDRLFGRRYFVMPARRINYEDSSYQHCVRNALQNQKGTIATPHRPLVHIPGDDLR